MPVIKFTGILEKTSFKRVEVGEFFMLGEGGTLCLKVRGQTTERHGSYFSFTDKEISGLNDYAEVQPVKVTIVVEAEPEIEERK